MIDLSAPLVVGFGVTGQAVVSALVSRGFSPSIIDDRPSEAAMTVAHDQGLTLTVAPNDEALEAIVAGATVLLPSPGIPDHHPAFAAASAAGLPVASEFDLAALWNDRPLVAITGTNGKTTVTMMVTDMLNRSGRSAEPVGNTPVPLVAAIDDPSIEIFVVEASSFRLAHSQRFAPSVATWLNFSPDHLDAHATLDAYRLAKAAIFRDLSVDATAIVNDADEIVSSFTPSDPNVVRFGTAEAEWRLSAGELIGPDGFSMPIDDIARRQPHDLANAAAAAATARAAGASDEAIRSCLATFAGLPHRVEFVGEHDGVRWFNDSKATVPHATLAAVGGFDSVVLIAGGRNKGLDMALLADAVPPVRAVVATGDAADEVEAVFASLVEVHRASTMLEAVETASELADSGDVVLLSPACTSFDWYPNYGARGDDFRAIAQSRFSQ